MLTMSLFSVSLIALLAQAPAALPATPEACLKMARDFVISEQRALKQVTGETVRKIDADKTCSPPSAPRSSTSRPCPSRSWRRSSPSTTKRRSRRSRRRRWIAGSRRRTVSAKSRAEVLAQAVISGLREPKSPERNARLEQHIDDLDRIDGGDVLDFKIGAHARMNGYYRGDDIDAGIIKHSTWLIDTAKAFTPAQRTQYGATIVNAHINMAEALAGRGQNDRAKALLAEAKSGWAEVEERRSHARSGHRALCAGWHGRRADRRATLAECTRRIRRCR